MLNKRGAIGRCWGSAHPRTGVPHEEVRGDLGRSTLHPLPLLPPQTMSVASRPVRPDVLPSPMAASAPESGPSSAPQGRFQTPGESLIGPGWFSFCPITVARARGQVPPWPMALLHGPSIPWPQAEHTVPWTAKQMPAEARPEHTWPTAGSVLGQRGQCDSGDPASLAEKEVGLARTRLSSIWKSFTHLSFRAHKITWTQDPGMLPQRGLDPWD